MRLRSHGDEDARVKTSIRLMSFLEINNIFSLSFHPTFQLSTVFQINDYLTIPILALKETRLESNYQLGNQTIFAT